MKQPSRAAAGGDVLDDCVDAGLSGEVVDDDAAGGAKGAFADAIDRAMSAVSPRG